MWKSFNFSSFLVDLRASTLCTNITSLDVDVMTAEYDAILTGLLNAHWPLKSFSYRVRLSSSMTSHWFDNQCSDMTIKHDHLNVAIVVLVMSVR